jgi:SAM-dependent methyltransferase
MPTNLLHADARVSTSIGGSAIPSPDPTPARPTDPDLIGNLNFWSGYNWQDRGDEWSEAWGSSDAMWHCTIYPRLRAFLPAENVLEIAPGFGRITNYLRLWSTRLSVVDLVDRCIDACRHRFRADSHISYFVNDGRSLAMIPDHSIDLCVSWDSLVHVERATLSAYLQQLRRKLRPGGIGFIHHSNLGEQARDLRPEDLDDRLGGRRRDITAALFAHDCAAAGLRCLSQEIIPWNRNGFWLDSFSLFMHDPAPGAHNLPPRVVRRHDWALELENARRISELYRKPPATIQ